jgi:GNAT superfamily N-acetyltransferase
MDLGIRVASETDLDALVRLGTAFRDHLRQSTPSDADFRASIARLLKDAGTEFFPACGSGETGLGYAQCRYRYPAWISALAAELEDIFVARETRRQGMGRQLLEFAMARATRRGCRRSSSLHSFRSWRTRNSDAQQFNALPCHPERGCLYSDALYPELDMLLVGEAARHEFFHGRPKA